MTHTVFALQCLRVGLPFGSLCLREVRLVSLELLALLFELTHLLYSYELKQH